MRRARDVLSAAVALAGIMPPACPGYARTAQAVRSTTIDGVAGGLGLQAIRGIDYDVCYPADAAEYEALGRNAVIMLTASSAISTELPLRTAYLTIRGVRVPLRRVAVAEQRHVGDGISQSTFYLIPLRFMKMDGRLSADFRGARQGFGVTTFTAKADPPGMPPFARLNEFDEPSDPDPAAVRAVIAREYPDAGAVAD